MAGDCFIVKKFCILETIAIFALVLLDEALEFLRSIPESAKDKVYYNIRRIECGEKNSDIFKKLEGSNIWEFRTLYNKVAYRLFAFWDTAEEGTVVVATHGIIKKSQRTPLKEIAKAESMRAEYFKTKNDE